MTHTKFVGLCTGLILLLSSLSAFADHYVPEDGEAVQIYMYCTGMDENKAYILNGQPNPIPDDIDCWVPNSPLMGIFIGDSKGVAQDPNTGDIFGIYNVYPSYQITIMGVLEEFSTPVYIAVKRHEVDA